MSNNSLAAPVPMSDSGRRRRTAQPKHFWNLAFTELWERFSYYGLQAVLTYYLIYTVTEGGLGLSETVAVSVVGAYGGTLYLSQLLGAWLADRLISARRLVFSGAVVITAGHLSLALLPGVPGLALGLVLIALGTGLLKTNITSIVGMLFSGWSRTARDAGFSYFYLSINLGAIFGPLSTGWLQSNVGFHWAFGLAALGMTAALIQYSVRMRALPSESDFVPNPVSRPGLVKAGLGALVFAIVVAALVAAGIITAANLNYAVGILIGAAALIYFTTILRSKHIDESARTRVAGYVPMWLGEALYYGFYLQLFTTVPLIITDRVDLSIGGWSIPEAWFSVVGTIALVLIIPVLATRWKQRGIGRLRPSAKFPLGFWTIGVAYLLMLLTTLSTGKDISPFFIAVCLIIAGISEVFVGPIGFSVVTRIAPERFKTQLVALKILTLGAGSTISGLLATMYTVVPAVAFFLVVGGTAVVAGLLLWWGSARIEAALDTGLAEPRQS